MDKHSLLKHFRSHMDLALKGLSPSSTPDALSKAVNKQVTSLRTSLLDSLLPGYIPGQTLSSDLLEDVLLIHYVSYVIMLDYRNRVWKYDYMAFSRRIGELWEPFCKLPFTYPTTETVSVYTPSTFEEVQWQLRNALSMYVANLHISGEEREHLLSYYDKVWSLVSSGAVRLDLDLHIKSIYGVYYDIDYKSGFGSNEKGNTNRLLLVGQIYKTLPEEHNTLLFVRQAEDENNNYLQTLKNSGLWEVYCADKAYEKIYQLSGFNLKSWIKNNMNWTEDISEEFREYLIENDLLKYLTW